MRDLIIEELTKIKEQTKNFNTENFKDFKIGSCHISNYPGGFNGLPDGILLIVYQEVLKFVFLGDLKNTMKQFCDGTYDVFDFIQWNFSDKTGEPKKLYDALIEKIKTSL